jgi:hypothetical protein
MSQKKHETKVKSLRLVSPRLYTYITNELQQTHNIQTYDLQIDALVKDKGMEITIRYGETFSHKETSFFTYEQIDEVSSEIKEFIAKIGEDCTKVMIDDYFKIYAP